MSDTVIKIENLSKHYRLGVIGHGTLYRDLQSWWAKIRKKADPNSLIGAHSNNKNSEWICALNNINLDVKKGEVLGVIGSNGAGKSTLLKILSKVTSPTTGLIKYKGRIASLLEVGTGFHSELTGRENIFLNGAINGMNKREVNKKLDEIVDFAGIERFLDTPVKRYSSGMYVRLGFAVAAHLDPDILIVDEVLAVGDASFQKKAINKMEDVSKEEGRTVLFVSHNMDSIKQLCTRSVLLKNGGVLKEGPTNEVVEYYLEQAETEETGPEINFKSDVSKDFQILSFGILKIDDEKSYYLDRTKPFKIYIEYLLRKPSEELTIQLVVSTAGNQNGVLSNTTVFQWSNRHYKKYKYNDEKGHLDSGRYKSYITFPGYILNSGNYKLKVHLAYADNWYEFNDEGILFELFDLESSHLLRSGRSAGLLGIPLDWETQQIKEN